MHKAIHDQFRYYVEPAQNERAPLIIFFHGTGERHNTNLDIVLRYGPLALTPGSVPFDCTIVHPQLNLTSAKWSVQYAALLLDHCMQLYNCDPTRIIFIGVSLGGLLVREFLNSEHGSKLNVAVLLSPGGNKWHLAELENIALLGIPLIVAHAKNDKNVNYLRSEIACASLNKIANKYIAHYTHMGLSGHAKSAWQRFMEPGNYFLWDWLKYRML